MKLEAIICKSYIKNQRVSIHINFRERNRERKRERERERIDSVTKETKLNFKINYSLTLHVIIGPIQNMRVVNYKLDCSF